MNWNNYCRYTERSVEPASLRMNVLFESSCTWWRYITPQYLLNICVVVLKMVHRIVSKACTASFRETFPKHTHIHTHIHTHTHTYTHTYTHTLPHTDTYIHTHTHTHILTHTHTHTHIHTYTHIHTHTHIYTHTPTHRHIHTHTHICVICCFSTAPLVARTQLNVTMLRYTYIACLLMCWTCVSDNFQVSWSQAYVHIHVKPSYVQTGRLVLCVPVCRGLRSHKFYRIEDLNSLWCLSCTETP